MTHRIYGPRPTPHSVPIVVLHGFLGSMKNVQNMCRRITSNTNRTVVAVDARNHGSSPYTDSHNYFDLAADVSRLITMLGVQKSILIGHSMGGRTAMVLALMEPSKVASQIIVDISPMTTTTNLKNTFPMVLEEMANIDFKGMNLNKAKLFARKKIFATGFCPSERDLHLILMNIGLLKDETIGWKYNLNALRDNTNKILSFPTIPEQQYFGPTLFLGGQLSYAVPPDDMPGIHELFPNAHLLFIKGAGHNVHLDNPYSFYEAVMQFLLYNALVDTKT
uniref:sn-1-specific diacylglycerol lipase ABHD11 n=1 Tax=Heliothis virescens TaxID=7102 RepID=A0A2A4JL41_HELVI